MPDSRKLLVPLVLVFVFFLSACGTSLKHYKAINQSLERGDYHKPVELIKKAREKGSYEKKDRVLYYLELGLANHYAGNYAKSSEQLKRAEDSMQELYTKSVSNIGKSLLTNDNELPYRGEAYEDIYVNFFKALNYAHLGQPSAAKVEIRRIYEDLSNMERRFKRQAEEYKEAVGDNNLVDPATRRAMSEQTADLESTEVDFHNSALGRYMSYAMYFSERAWDDVRIDLQKIKEAFLNQPQIYNFPQPALPKPGQAPEGRVPVHAFALLGRGPRKVQETTRLVVSEDVGQVKLAMPEMIQGKTHFTAVKLYRNGRELTTLEKMESVNRVAKAVFEAKEPLILFKTMLRVVIKEVATNKVRDQAKGSMGLALAVAGEIYKEISEQADLRTCRLLPGEVHVKSFFLPPGEHQLEARFYSGPQVVDVRKITVKISPNSLNLIEVVNLR